MLVEDGTGKGYKLEIDDENMAHILSVSESEQHHTNSAHGEAYTFDIDAVTISGAGEYFVVIKNTDDKSLHISSVTLFMPEFSDTAIVEAYIGGTFAYSANGTVVVPSNCNAGSGKTATGVFYKNDGGGDLATIVQGSIAGRFMFDRQSIKWEKKSHWILPKNQCFMLICEKGQRIAGYISFYYHNDQWSE